MDRDALIETLQQTIATQAVMLEKLNQQIEQLLRVLYGKKSEKIANKKEAPEPESKPVKLPHSNASKSQKQASSKRSRLPDNLERIEVVHDIKPEEKRCQHCRRDRHSIGQRVTEQLDFIPARLIVRKHICLKYSYRCGLGGVVQAQLPNQPIEKGIPGPGLLADIIVSKYQDHLPLYRQRLRFKRQGVDVPDSTMGDWVQEVAFLLKPIVSLMREQLLKYRKIHTDDTPIPVMGKGKTKTGRLWTYLADMREKPAICVYDYTPTRHSSGPVRFLKTYKNYLQADAYSGYDKLYEDGEIIEVGCMAYCRRKFFDVAKAAKGESKAGDVIELIGKLYQIEKHVKNWDDTERYHFRKQHAKPILKLLRRKIKKYYSRAMPGTPFYKALQYALNHWRALCCYLSDGCLSIDNNAAERAIKSVVLGRKNWLFAGSDNGGEWAATIYSIVETCKLNNINTNAYLTDVLARIPNTLQKDIQTLLPYYWKPEPS